MFRSLEADIRLASGDCAVVLPDARADEVTVNAVAAVWRMTRIDARVAVRRRRGIRSTESTGSRRLA